LIEHCLQELDKSEKGLLAMHHLPLTKYFRAIYAFSAIVYYIEMFEYIAQGNLNIRIHRDITGEMWFGVDKV